MAKRITVCAGIDTGKRKLDVAIDGNGEPLQVENTAEGHQVLLDWLQRHKVKRIGIEASGGYGVRVADARELMPALQRALHVVQEDKRQALVNVRLEASYVKTS